MPVTLRNDEQELLREEVDAFAAAIPDDELRAQYAYLAQAVDAGELPDEALGPVGVMLEVALQTGRVRKVHRAVGEQTLLRLWGKTPGGTAHAAALADLNAALAQLVDQKVESVRVLSRVPGTYLLAISTDACEITLRFSPDGAAVEAVGVGI